MPASQGTPQHHPAALHDATNIAAHGCSAACREVRAGFWGLQSWKSAFHAAGCRSLSLWPIALLGRSGAGQGAPALVLLIPSPDACELSSEPLHTALSQNILSWHCVRSDASSSPHPPHPPLLWCDLGHAFPILCSSAGEHLPDTGSNHPPALGRAPSSSGEPGPQPTP